MYDVSIYVGQLLNLILFLSMLGRIEFNYCVSIGIQGILSCKCLGIFLDEHTNITQYVNIKCTKVSKQKVSSIKLDMFFHLIFYVFSILHISSHFFLYAVKAWFGCSVCNKIELSTSRKNNKNHM